MLGAWVAEPAQEGQTPNVSVSYVPVLQELAPDESLVEAARQEHGHFVLLTDHLDREVQPDAAILQEYRASSDCTLALLAQNLSHA